MKPGRKFDSARAEDVAFMAATGESATGAAERLGISRAGLEKWCTKNGQRADWIRLLLNDPRDHNGQNSTEATFAALRQELATITRNEPHRKGGRPPGNPACGTEQGYQQHRYRSEECAECRRAHAEHERKRYATRYTEREDVA